MGCSTAYAEHGAYADAFRTMHEHLCSLGHEAAPDYGLLRTAFSSWTPESLPGDLSEAADSDAQPLVHKATQTEPQAPERHAAETLSSPAPDTAAALSNGKRSTDQSQHVPARDAQEAKRQRTMANGSVAPSVESEPAAEACYQQLSSLCKSIREVCPPGQWHAACVPGAITSMPGGQPCVAAGACAVTRSAGGRQALGQAAAA